MKKKNLLLFPAIMDLTEDEVREKRPDVPIYNYRISNYRPYPVHIWIEYDEKKPLKLWAYGLYHHISDTFYATHVEEFKLKGIHTLRGQAFQKKTKKGIFITIQPKSRIEISVVLHEDFEFCGLRDRMDPEYYNIQKPMHWLGLVVQYPDLKIHQLISDKIDNIPLSQNILYTLDTKAGKYFSVITDPMRKIKRRSYKTLFFLKSRCSRPGEMGDPTPDFL